MAAVELTPADLAPFSAIESTKAQAMIDDTLARAARFAPCIEDAEFAYPAAAKAVLRAVVLRWNDAGSGALSSQTAGPFGQAIDTRRETGPKFWPSEISELQALCQTDDSTGGAFNVDTVSTYCGGHADICALNFGAEYCSCGAVLTAGLYPLYENVLP